MDTLQYHSLSRKPLCIESTTDHSSLCVRSSNWNDDGCPWLTAGLGRSTDVTQIDQVCWCQPARAASSVSEAIPGRAALVASDQERLVKPRQARNSAQAPGSAPHVAGDPPSSTSDQQVRLLLSFLLPMQEPAQRQAIKRGWRFNPRRRWRTCAST